MALLVGYTDEEVDRCYEEFYEDVHTEFLKYGELVNFKVCKNGSFHLRGNVYVHYKSLDSAVLAYHSINGRYFAGKQVKCEFVNVTRWKIAICGEFMKSRLKTCSHGTACNFIHCFRNPGGDYEWADWDKPPPRYWVKKMAALFGYSAESEYERQMEYEKSKSISKRRTIDTERHRARSKSQDTDQLIRRPSRSSVAEDEVQKTTRHRRYTNDSRRRSKVPDNKSCEENSKSKDYHRGESRRYESESDEGWLRRDVHAGRERHRHHGHTRKRSKYSNKVSEDSIDFGENRSGMSLSDSAEWSDGGRKGQARHNHNLSNSAEVASLDDGVRADGNKLDRDRERTLSSRLDRSSSHRNEASKTIDADTSPDDGYYSGKSRHKHRHHVKKCSGSQESNKCLNDKFDDRNRRHGSDRDKEKHHSHKRKRSRGSPEISNEAGAARKRLKEKSNSDRSEIEKSRHRCKSYDSDSIIEETVGQDRWEAESPGRWGDIRSEPLSSDKDYHNNEKMDRVGLGKSTSWDRNSAGFYADSKSRGHNDRRNNNRPNRDEIVTASPKEPEEGDDENNKIRLSKHKSCSYK